MQQLSKEQQNYVMGVLAACSKEATPASVTTDEIRLAKRHRLESRRMSQIQGEMSQLRQQVVQAEAKLRSLELQAADTNGRMASTVEYMVNLKFPETEEAEAPKPVSPKSVPKGPAPVVDTLPAPVVNQKAASTKKRSK